MRRSGRFIKPVVPIATAIFCASLAPQVAEGFEREHSVVSIMNPVGRPDRPLKEAPKYTKEDLSSSLIGACKLPGSARYVPPEDWGERKEREGDTTLNEPMLKRIDIEFKSSIGQAIIDRALRSRFTRPAYPARYVITDHTAKAKNTTSQIDWINIYGCSLVYPAGKAPSAKLRPISVVYKKPTVIEPDTVLSITNKYSAESPSIGNMCRTNITNTVMLDTSR